MVRGKKVLAAIMALVMIMSMLPASAFAEGVPPTHTHSEACYQTVDNKVCPLEEDEEHTHTAECYEQQPILVCGQAETYAVRFNCAQDGTAVTVYKDNEAVEAFEAGVYVLANGSYTWEASCDGCVSANDVFTVESANKDIDVDLVPVTPEPNPDDPDGAPVSPYVDMTAQELYDEYQKLIAEGDEDAINTFIAEINGLVADGLIDEAVFEEFTLLVLDGDDGIDPHDGNGITFELSANAGSLHDVNNGTEDITIYCLQQNYAWPHDYIQGLGTYTKQDGTSSILTPERLEIIRRLMYAGYPHDALGILHKAFFEDESDEWYYKYDAAEVTQQAIWQLMSEWGIEGNDAGFTAAGEFKYLTDQLIEFAKSDKPLPNPNDLGEVTFSGSGKFVKNEFTGKWETGALQITGPSGLGLYYTLTLPAGITAVNKNDVPITHILENETFYLISDTEPDLASNNKLEVSANFSYPSDVSSYETKDTVEIEGDGNSGNTEQRALQTMLSVSIATKPVAGELELSKDGVVELTEVSGHKTWDDVNAPEGKRPTSISVHLHANGEDVTGTTKTVTAADGWAYTWTDLPKYADGAEIHYEVVEDEIADYTATYSGYNITNTYTPDKIEFAVEKHWADNNNQDGIRPESVTVKLLKKASDTDTFTDTQKRLTLSAENNWEGIFTDLDKNFTYKVEEVSVNGYDSAVSNPNPAVRPHYAVITNTHKPETLTVSGTKTWVLPAGETLPADMSIKVHLHANNEEVEGSEKTLDASTGWNYSWSDLPKYENGHEIIYTVVEAPVEGYTPTYSPDNYDIINTYEPDKTNIPVIKVWHDNDDQDGLRPDSVTVVLYANGVKTDKTLTLNADNAWEGEFVHLDKTNTSGKPITYTVHELLVPGYSASYTHNTIGGYTITNSHHPATVKVSGTKTWDHGTNTHKPTSITVRLLADGVEKETLTVHESDNWKYEFINLPKYHNGEAIVYTVIEDKVDDYSASYSDKTVSTAPNDIIKDIANAYTPNRINIEVEKEWHDNDDQDDIRPESIVVMLVKDGEEQKNITIELKAENNWEGAFTNLIEKEGGRIIHYSVKEVLSENSPYTSEIFGSADTVFTIVNKYTPETVTVSGTKTWVYNSAAASDKPTEITVRLHANGSVIDHQKVTAANSWQYKWENLPKKAGGELIVYTVTEDAIDNYSTVVSAPVISGNTITSDITNTFVAGKTSLAVSKIWNDNSNQDGKRPDKIIVTLIANGVEQTDKTIELNAGNSWSNTFKELPEYDASHVKITYSVKENKVDGYTSILSGNALNGYTFTNTHTPEKTNVYGSKTWVDDNDRDGKRPASITIRLYADGAEIDKKVVTKDNNWHWNFSSLPKYKDGKLIKYTITEDAVNSYRTEYHGYNVTNIHRTGTIATGDDSNPALWAMSFALSAIGAVGMFGSVRRKKKS